MIIPSCAVCQGNGCSKRNECYRFRADPDARMIYINFEYICSQLNDYKYFYEIGDRKVKPIEEEVELLKEGKVDV